MNFTLTEYRELVAHFLISRVLWWHHCTMNVLDGCKIDITLYFNPL